MITIPEDFFEESYNDRPTFERSIPFAKQRALDIKRLVDTGVICRSKFARLMCSVSIKTGECFDINCKSWRCVKHREKWGRKWSMILGERLKTMNVTLLVNLTTAEMTDHETVFKALRRFMQKFRVKFGPTEYIKVVEYNKNHTQPHFHLLLSCEDLKPSSMPANFREQNLSWPVNVYEYIKQLWGDCLEYFAPDQKRTTVVWCQPPLNAGASASYAIGYVTGVNAKKDEEPDETWRGRKLTYSKLWFDRPVSDIWHDILVQLFGEKDPEDKFFWLPNDYERIIGESPLMFANSFQVKQRFFEAKYYSEHGFYPILKDPSEFDPEMWDYQELWDRTFNINSV